MIMKTKNIHYMSIKTPNIRFVTTFFTLTSRIVISNTTLRTIAAVSYRYTNFCTPKNL